METLFLKLVNLSLTASWLLLTVFILRLVFRKAPKWINCMLWGLAGIRLVCPVSIKSALSLIPSAQPLPQDIIYAAIPRIQSGVKAIDNAINPILATSMTPAPLASANPLQIWSFILSWVWIIGMTIMLIYAAASFLLLKHRVATAINLQKNIKQSERVDSPFVLGFFHPVIYLPYQISDTDLEYVIAHEKAHIRRRDHWWKPVGFVLLSIYWFNPLLWIAYILFCRDIEAACDEKVIQDMEQDGRRAYSTALLNCSVNHRTIAACPLAFGEVSVKNRIKSIMNYQKPAFWLIALALTTTAIAAICLLTNPAEPELIPGTTYVSRQCLYMNSFSSLLSDSGRKYIIGDNYFATVQHNNESLINIISYPDLDTMDSDLKNVIDVPKWRWQEFPYTDEEWDALFKPKDFNAVNGISQLYDEILYQPLAEDKFLLLVDGNLWLVELASNPQMGTYLWSIHSLVPESATGLSP